MDNRGNSDDVTVMEEPSSAVIDISDDDDDIAIDKDKMAKAHQPAPESDSVPPGRTNPAAIHHMFHSRMEQYLSKNNHHQSVPGIIVSKEAVKKRVILSYLLLDSDSDYDDVEFCDPPAEQRKLEANSSTYASRSCVSAGNGSETESKQDQNSKRPTREVAEASEHNKGLGGSVSAGGMASKEIPVSLDLEVEEADESLDVEAGIGKLVDCKTQEEKAPENVTIETAEQDIWGRSNSPEKNTTEAVSGSPDLEVDEEEPLDLEVEEGNDSDESSGCRECVEEDVDEDSILVEYVPESNKWVARISGQDEDASVKDSESHKGMDVGAGNMTKQKQQNKPIDHMNTALELNKGMCQDIVEHEDSIAENQGADEDSLESESSVCETRDRKIKELREVSSPGRSCEISDPPYAGGGQGISGQKRKSSDLDHYPHTTMFEPSSKSRRNFSVDLDKASKVLRSLIATKAAKEGSQNLTESISMQPKNVLQAQQPLRPVLLVRSSQQGVMFCTSLNNNQADQPECESPPPESVLWPLQGHCHQSYQAAEAGSNLDGPHADFEESAASTSAPDSETGGIQLKIEDVFQVTDETHGRMGQGVDESPVAFPAGVNTLLDENFLKCLQETQPSQSLLKFLLDSQDAKFQVCSVCEDNVLTHPVFLWGVMDVMMSNINGVLMVTMQELARIGFIDYHIAGHHLLDKKLYPAVWNFVRGRRSQQCVDGVSLVFVLYIIEYVLILAEPQSSKRYMALTQALNTPFQLVGQRHTGAHGCLARSNSDGHSSIPRFKCSGVTCKLVKAKRRMLMLNTTEVNPESSSENNGIETLLDTNPSICRTPEELALSSAWELAMNHQRQNSQESGVSFSRSLQLMYPSCACMEMSKMDLMERASWRTIQKTRGSQVMSSSVVVF